MEDSFLDYAVRASLVDMLDKKVLVLLRDGRAFTGNFLMFDQYSNIVLNNTVERLSHDTKYCDVPRGTFVIRGENIVMVGDQSRAVEETGEAVSKEEITKLIADSKPDTNMSLYDDE